MELGGVSKPAGVTVQVAPERTGSPVSVEAVKTELSSDKTVQQMSEVNDMRYKSDQLTQKRAALDTVLRNTIDRNLKVDPQSRQVVFQEVERPSGRVVRQIPDEALLRIRAYVRETGKSEPVTDPGSDVQHVERVV